MIPDNFHKRVKDCSGLSLYCNSPEQTLRAIPFFINGLRLQGNTIVTELIDREDGEFEFSIGIDDLLDGFEEYIKYSHPDNSKEYKKETIECFEKAIARIKTMECE